MASRDSGGAGAQCAWRCRGKRPNLLALVACVAACVVACAAPSAAGDSAGAGVSSRDARRQATQEIPWGSLGESQREAVRAVVNDPTLYRRMPTRIADCDPELFEFLVDNPELVVEVWGMLGISRLRLERIDAERFRATDGTGTGGVVRVLHRSGGGDQPLRLVTHAEGVYEAPPMPSAVTATCVMVLTAHHTRESNGRCYVTADCDSFMRLDKPVAVLVLKTLHPLVVKTADHNFTETVRFASLFSRTAQRSPDGMERLAQKLTSVDEPRRAEFVRVCQRVAARESERLAARYSTVPAVAIVPTERTVR
ncbi:MAG: hypothetical protein ACRCT8_02405 [Lacipirellulaceae bacterium]